MEHDGIHIFKDCGVKYAGLAKRYPISEAGFGKYRFCLNLAYGIVVINTDFDGVAGSCPVNGRVSVACFGNSAYINDLDLVGVGLSFNRPYYVLCRRYVGFKSFERIVVCRGGYHSADMKNVVRTCYGLKNVVVICQIAPDELNAGVICINLKKLFVFIAAPVEQNNVVFVSFGIKLFKACQAHCSR